MLDKDKVMSVSRTYAAEVKKKLNPDMVLLFGSYANGNAREWSDIDIAVIIYGFKGNRLSASADLYDMCSLLGDETAVYIEPHLLDERDEVSGFLGEVIRTGIPLI